MPTLAVLRVLTDFLRQRLRVTRAIEPVPLLAVPIDGGRVASVIVPEESNPRPIS